MILSLLDFEKPLNFNHCSLLDFYLIAVSAANFCFEFISISSAINIYRMFA